MSSHAGEKAITSLETRQMLGVLCRIPLTNEARERLAAANPDWDSLISLAAAWDVEPVVLQNLRQHFRESMPEELATRVAEREREVRAWALTQSLMTVNLAHDLERAGIPVIILKGPAISVLGFGDPSLRTSGDIDLLVRYEHLPATRDFLLDRGYSRDYDPSVEPQLIADQHALEFSNGRKKVEVHWTLLSRHLRFDVPLDELWSSSRKIECTGSEIRVLSAPHLLVFLCAHAAKHQWSMMRWALDIAQLVDRMDDDDVSGALDLASRVHARRLLALGLRVARDLFGQDISRFPADALVPESETQALIADLSHPDERRPTTAIRKLYQLHPGVAPLAYWARTRERIVDRVSCFLILAVKRALPA